MQFLEGFKDKFNLRNNIFHIIETPKDGENEGKKSTKNRKTVIELGLGATESFFPQKISLLE